MTTIMTDAASKTQIAFSNNNNGLMDVDMLDVADLEKERGGDF